MTKSLALINIFGICMEHEFYLHFLADKITGYCRLFPYSKGRIQFSQKGI